jgi:tetratricopeptide (TPR) repeat protein
VPDYEELIDANLALSWITEREHRLTNLALHLLERHGSAFKLIAALMTLLLVGCAQQPTIPAEKERAAVPAPPKPQPSAKLPQAPRVLPNQQLSPSILFKLVLAEIAMQRGQANIAVQSYLELARETKDPRIAQRATEIAWSSRFTGAALEMASMWVATDPESPHARQVLVALLVGQGRLAEAQPYLEQSLAADQDNAGASLLQLNTLLARNPDKAAVLELVQTLAQPYLMLPEAHYAVAQAALGAGAAPLALHEVREALKLRPEWEQAALLQGQLLQRQSNAHALQFFQDYLKKYPKALDVRLNYARLLVGEKKLAQARAEFQALLREFPSSPEVTVAVGLLSLQLNDYDAAQTQLVRALEGNYKDPDALRFYLGQLNEQRKHFDEALRWYGAVTAGDQYVAARARYATILAQQGKLDAARKYLKDSARDPQQIVLFSQAEAQLLREANDYRSAYDVLTQALEKNPNSPELLYDQAMAAEKLNRIDVLESNLRKVIQIKPNDAHAYNALGYTLADRNERLPEAYALIDKALKLAPDDAFIMDSMGWVLYRMGKIEAALGFLRRAFELRPDGEIAAHLGEVLWANNQREEAQKIWKGALKDHPGNEVLLATVKKFSP